MPGPDASAHQVLVYSGPGVSPISLSHTLLTLSLLLLPHYTVQPITPATLSTQPWEPNCALLVIPGGRDLPFVDELSTKTRVTHRIKEYVREGGRYLGICAGAYFGTEEVVFDKGGDMEVRGKRDLAFVPGSCEGPTFPGFAYAAESGSRAVSLILNGPSSSKRTLDHVYYNGGGHFALPNPIPSNVEVLARYDQEKNGLTEPPIAAVASSVGKGKAVLCSVHFEYPLNDPPARDAIAKLGPPPSAAEIEESERSRIEWAGEILIRLGLDPPGRQQAKGSSVPIGPGDEDPELLLHPTHPSPIFVLSHPSLPQLATGCFQVPGVRGRMVDQEGGLVLKDANDEILIKDLKSFSASSPSATTAENQITKLLSEKRRSAPVFPPSLHKLDIQDSDKSASTPEPAQPPDFNALTKTFLAPSQAAPYSSRWTPLFNFDTYWSELNDARKRVGRKSGHLRKDEVEGGERASLGDLLFYAETVTSTQTMLDRNPILLTGLPAPLAFLASFQLSGRGRGSNIWLSPAGCLQFSLLLTLPNSLSSKIVFIQYLMALAVCEAVDEDGRLGVRIKWPNDIYAEVEGVGDSKLGSGKKGKAKLGGILVNTNYVGGKWRLVIGCGINTLNTLPTTSLSQLHSLLAAKQPTSSGSSKPLPSAPTMEGVFAKIMNSFEMKWEQFIEEKGFHGFLDEYYGRWLHSNQEVTLTTTEPHTKLRIHSITPDHGLLRCVPLDPPSKGPSGLTPLYQRGDFGGDDRSSAYSTAKQEERWVDLQPDGNSFDLMSGLIKRKV